MRRLATGAGPVALGLHHLDHLLGVEWLFRFRENLQRRSDTAQFLIANHRLNLSLAWFLEHTFSAASVLTIVGSVATTTALPSLADLAVRFGPAAGSKRWPDLMWIFLLVAKWSPPTGHVASLPRYGPQRACQRPSRQILTTAFFIFVSPKSYVLAGGQQRSSRLGLLSV